MSGKRLLGPGHAPVGKKCHHLHEYGLYCSDYEALRMRSGDQCEICGVAEKDAPGRQLLIDHNHETGDVRGMVCAKCNTVMACFDGTKTWGTVNRLWERRAKQYIARARQWVAYGQACEQLGTTRFEDMQAHIRDVVTWHGEALEVDEPEVEEPIVQAPRRPGVFPRADCPVCGVEVSFRKDGKPTWHQSRLPSANGATCQASA